jgi:protein SCO1/2
MTSKHRVSPRLAGTALASGLLLGTVASSADETPADPHALHHQAMLAPPAVARRMTSYVAPDVALVRSDGARVNFAHELDDGRPVLLDFIYTSCTTICPVMSQTFAEMQKRLGPDVAKVKMISVSIDPEEDTPSRLTEYAERYRAGGQWSFYTGTVQASIAVQRAFDVYRGDKMNHVPVTLLRAAPGAGWLRLDGFVTTDQLMGEYRQLPTQK